VLVHKYFSRVDFRKQYPKPSGGATGFDAPVILIRWWSVHAMVSEAKNVCDDKTTRLVKPPPVKSDTKDST
jgi:hypothetical protein